MVITATVAGPGLAIGRVTGELTDLAEKAAAEAAAVLRNGRRALPGADRAYAGQAAAGAG